MCISVNYIIVGDLQMSFTGWKRAYVGIGRPASHDGPATVRKLVAWAVTRGQSLIRQSR